MEKTRNWRGLFRVVPVFWGLMLLLGAAAVAVAAGGECTAMGKLTKELAPQAELVALSCEFKPFDGVKSLYIKVTLKNVSDKPQRFRVNMFFDNGKAVGGLIPRKVNKGLVQPGATASFTYPVKGMDQPAKETMIRIKTVE